MKKGYIIVDVLMVLCAAGAHYIKYFTDRKLGFVRWLNYNGARLRENYPLGTIKIAAAAVILMLAVIALLGILKYRQQLNVADYIMSAVMQAAVGYYIYATAVIVNTVTPCAFLLVPVLGCMAFMAVLRNLMRGRDLKKIRKIEFLP